MYYTLRPEYGNALTLFGTLYLNFRTKYKNIFESIYITMNTNQFLFDCGRSFRAYKILWTKVMNQY